MKTITNKIALLAVLNSTADLTYTLDDNVWTNEEIRNKLYEMLEKMNNKKVSAKALQNQEENKTMKEHILNFLTSNPDSKYLVTELLENVPEFKDSNETLTTQKISSLMRQLYLADKVEKEVIKGRSYFSKK